MAIQFTVHLQRSHKSMLAVFFIVVIGLAYVAYERISPTGRFAELQNDLHTINPAEGSGYTDLSGNPVDLHAYKGKIIVANAWATWMPFSQTELPALAQLKQRYGDAVIVLAVNRKEDPALVTSYMHTLSDISGLTVLIDPADTFYKAIGGYAMPETVVYAPDGRIVYHARGVAPLEELTQAIDALQKK